MKKKAADIIISALLILFGIFMMTPVAITVIKSFEGGIIQYSDFFIWKPLYLSRFMNSIIIAGYSALGNMIIAVFGAYVFAKVKFKGRDILFYLYIIVMMMPFQVTLLPQYIVSKNLNIYNSFWALILPGIFTPFGVFLLTQIMKTVPDDMIEAARLDTGSTFRIITQIAAPSIRPGIICLAVLNFTEYWNMVEQPLILLETEAIYPLSITLRSIEVTEVFAAITIFLIPPMLLYLWFKDEIIEGLAAYRLK